MSPIAKFLSLLLVVLLAAPALAGLSTGDSAPPLSVAEWIKGDAVDPTKGDPNTLYVIDFWATWCMPCRASFPYLSELQTHFEKSKKVIVIGISDEAPAAVRRFVQAWDGKMQFAVAADAERRTSKAYLDGVGAQGIPHTFLIKGGKLVWHGHPLEADETIARLTDDKTWMQTATRLRQARTKREELRDELRDASNARDWKKAVAAADKLIELDPMDPAAHTDRYILFAAKMKDPAQAATEGDRINAYINDPVALERLAHAILTEDAFADHRDLLLARTLAKKAAKLTKMEDPEVLETLALAMAMNGDYPMAVRMQELALKHCDGQGKAELRARLERGWRRYQQAKTDGVLPPDEDPAARK